MALRRKIDVEKRALGRESRHSYVDVEALGEICRDCGRLKPRMDEKEEPCKLEAGQAVDVVLRMRRERAIPSLVLGRSWQRMLPGCEFDPNTVKANRNATRQAFVGLPEDLFKEQLGRSIGDATTIYQAVDAETDARTHGCAAAMFAVRLVDLSLLDEPQNMAVLIGLRILQEAEENPSEWNYTPGLIQPMVEKMLRVAQTLGYYGMKIRVLPTG